MRIRSIPIFCTLMAWACSQEMTPAADSTQPKNAQLCPVTQPGTTRKGTLRIAIQRIQYPPGQTDYKKAEQGATLPVFITQGTRHSTIEARFIGAQTREGRTTRTFQGRNAYGTITVNIANHRRSSNAEVRYNWAPIHDKAPPGSPEGGQLTENCNLGSILPSGS